MVGPTYPEVSRISFYDRTRVMFLPFYALLKIERDVVMRVYRNLPWMDYEDYEYPVDASLSLAPQPRRIVMSGEEFLEKRDEWYKVSMREFGVG